MGGRKVWADETDEHTGGRTELQKGRMAKKQKEGEGYTEKRDHRKRGSRKIENKSTRQRAQLHTIGTKVGRRVRTGDGGGGGGGWKREREREEDR
jgi:hypothetical protein